MECRESGGGGEERILCYSSILGVLLPLYAVHQEVPRQNRYLKHRSVAVVDYLHGFCFESGICRRICPKSSLNPRDTVIDTYTNITHHPVPPSCFRVVGGGPVLGPDGGSGLWPDFNSSQNSLKRFFAPCCGGWLAGCRQSLFAGYT